jgi:dipeptidyl aminopeptidase/acylaminoacyl peptidase
MDKADFAQSSDGIPDMLSKRTGSDAMRKFMVLAALANAALCSAAQDPETAKHETGGTMFGVRESVQQIDISPDGNRIVYLEPGPGRITGAYVVDSAGAGEPQRVLLTDGSPDRLRWCRFSGNERLICQISGQINSVGYLVPYSRLVAIGIDGKDMAMLGQTSSQYDQRLRQFDGEILDWLPDESGSVLMAREYIPEAGKIGTKLVRSAEGTGIDRIDTLSMQVTRLEPPSKTADFFISDGHGNIRIKGWRPDSGTGQLGARTVYHFRQLDSKEWLPFSTWGDGDGMAPIAVDADSNSAYVLKKLDGRLALYRVKLDGSMATELVYKNSRVDVDDVVRVNRDSRIIGVTFAEEKRNTVYFDPRYAKLTASLSKALPDLPIIEIVAASADEMKLVVRAGSDSDPGRYYIYDAGKRALNEILLARPGLEGAALASVKPISFPAADGTSIPAYLTLPPGKENVRGLPAVVLPHGGPSARDEWGFDWLAQFLAHQGFAVLQPNYRGSSGFGDAWLQENGFKSWRTSIGDVASAGRWLVSQGIADANKLAIVGWSYGGYAALQTGVVEPGLFKALVAIAPVTDLDLIKQEARYYTNADLVLKEVGNGPHVGEGSPLQNAVRIEAPVLMFHGDRDMNVGVQQSRKMDAKLRASGKASELVVYEGLEHDLADSGARIQMLDRIAAFLKSSLAIQ